MDLEFTPEQEVLRGVVRDFLAETHSEQRLRELSETEIGFDRDDWRRMAQELGLHGLAIDAVHGGAGYGLAELAVVFAEQGRALYGGPFLSTVGMAARALGHSGDEAAQASYLPAIVAGELVAAVALLEETGARNHAVTATEAEGLDGFRLDGTKQLVLDAQVADVVFVVAGDGDGGSLFAVERDAPGLVLTPRPMLDLTRRAATLDFDSVPAKLIGARGEGPRILGETRNDVLALVAAEQWGAAERVLELAVEYAKVREQYGRPIGSFQAIKHMCADMLLSVESMRSVSTYAVQTADGPRDELPEASSIAAAFAARRFCQIAGTCIQVFGGIGVTWEHPAHLYFKRAHATKALFGDPSIHKENLLAARGI